MVLANLEHSFCRFGNWLYVTLSQMTKLDVVQSIELNQEMKHIELLRTLSQQIETYLFDCVCHREMN